MVYYNKSNKYYLSFEEGFGDGLETEDYEAGFVGYIDYSIYATLEAIDDGNTIDGGMVLIKKPYSEYKSAQLLKLVIDIVEDGSTTRDFIKVQE